MALSAAPSALRGRPCFPSREAVSRLRALTSGLSPRARWLSDPGVGVELLQRACEGVSSGLGGAHFAPIFWVPLCV